jgi:hypothetical protein
LEKTIAGHTSRSAVTILLEMGCFSNLTAVGEDARGSAGNARPINWDLTHTSGSERIDSFNKKLVEPHDYYNYVLVFLTSDIHCDRDQDRRHHLESAASMLLHSLTKKVNLKEEAVKADASYDYVVLQFLLALLMAAGRGRRPARGSVWLYYFFSVILTTYY